MSLRVFRLGCVHLHRYNSIGQATAEPIVRLIDTYSIISAK
jgi:hypothetical protein